MIANISSIRSLINDGVSLIPVKGAWGGKRPYETWGKSPINSFDQLINVIEKFSNGKYSLGEDGKHYPCEHIAIRTGRFSNGVVCLDIDTKNKEGFGAVILNDFRTLYPEIYEKIRIDKSPSGGYHFYYRIKDYGQYLSKELGGNAASGEGLASKPNLAARAITDEEFAAEPKKGKYRNFVELKIEGQLSHCYPSSGYIRVKESGSVVAFREGDDSILGILEKWEHEALVSACAIYDESVEVQGGKIKGIVSERYSTNPFEHFNNSEKGARVLYDNGWTLYGTYGKWERYQKPGRKNKEIDATFNKDTRIYKIWSTNASLDAKGYTPAALLGYLKLNDDQKALYQYLVSDGFGILKKGLEENIVKRAIKTGEILPANISDEGKARYVKEVTKKKEKYQYGIFWEVREEGGYKISREGIYNVGFELGFRSYKDNPCLIDGYVVKKVDERFFYDKLKEYIIYGVTGNSNEVSLREIDLGITSGIDISIGNIDIIYNNGSEGAGEEVFSLDSISEEETAKVAVVAQISKEASENGVDLDLLDAYESFLQNSGKFTITRLPIFDTKDILKSTKKLSYKFFKNCYIIISAENIEICDYSELNDLIWESDIIQRDFVELPEFNEVVDSGVIGYKNGEYFKFIQNAIGWSTYTENCIGFCAHDYKDEESYFILATEKCENPNEGGGSGKNIFCNLFKLTTSVKNSAGSMLKTDNQLMQSWNYQRLFVIADLPKKFDFEFFKELINGDSSVKKLYKDEFDVGVHDMPKFIGSTNFSFDISEPGIKRRIRPLEFTNYYIDRGGVRAATGKMFPGEWDEFDFNSFDNIIINCIKSFLKANCYIDLPKLSDTGWNKQFEIRFTHLHDFFKEKMEKWVFIGLVPTSEFNIDYETFKRENNLAKGLSSHTINIALTEYCKEKGIPFAHKLQKDDGTWTDGIIWRTPGLVPGSYGATVRGRVFGDALKKFYEEKKKAEIIEEEVPF